MKANRKGFTLVELLVVIGILGILMGALFPAITAAMLRANLASASMRGRNLYVAITSANTEREAAGLGSVWPRTKAASQSSGEPDIADQGFNSAYEYFNVLFDTDKMSNANQWQPYISGVDLGALSGAGVNPPSGGQELKAENVGWSIGANIQDEMEDIIPIIVSRNVKCGQLLKKYEGTDNARVGLGTVGGSQYNTPFSNKGFVMIRKGGGALQMSGQYCRYQVIYNRQVFEIPEAGEDMDDFCYLTPDGRENPM